MIWLREDSKCTRLDSMQLGKSRLFHYRIHQMAVGCSILFIGLKDPGHYNLRAKLRVILRIMKVAIPHKFNSLGTAGSCIGVTPQRANTRVLSMSFSGYVSIYGSVAYALTGNTGSFAMGCPAGSHAVSSSSKRGSQLCVPSRLLPYQIRHDRL